MTVLDVNGHLHGDRGRYTNKANTAPVGELTDEQPAAGPCARCETEATGEDGLCDRHTTRWGELTLRTGSRTPWGAAQQVSDVAPGIAVASCAQHGGLKLSTERNSLIPAALRNSSGWYEEDCEINIPLHYFPDEWCSQSWVRQDPDTLRDETDQSIKDWFPTQWEAANGRELAPGESRTKDQRCWLEAQGDAPIATSAAGAETDPGMLVVTARAHGHDGNGEHAEYLVPRDEYQAARDKDQQQLGQDGRFVIDPARHRRLPPQAPAPGNVPALVRYPDDRLSASALSQQYIDGDLTATARDRVAKDLGQRWRRADGNVESLRDILAAGVNGKTAYQEGSAMKYAILQPSADGKHTYSLRVSKATWDYLDEIPDERTPATIAQQHASVAGERLERSNRLAPEYRREQARVERLYSEADRLRKLETAEREAREGTREQKQETRRQAQANRERAATITPG
ncbi:DUF7007 domain-containing protein [Microbacterium sp.]|uniref:DUF7007 domain-containing protein n=1 Tax=Microbacterium sp. TaxID=51671 RepID=UPI003A8BA3F6